MEHSQLSCRMGLQRRIDQIEKSDTDTIPYRIFYCSSAIEGYSFGACHIAFLLFFQRNGALKDVGLFKIRAAKGVGLDLEGLEGLGDGKTDTVDPQF